MKISEKFKLLDSTLDFLLMPAYGLLRLFSFVSLVDGVLVYHFRVTGLRPLSQG